MNANFDLRSAIGHGGDLLIGALGYEQRSSFVARQSARNYGKVVLFSYGSTGILSFDENCKFAKEIGCLIKPKSNYEEIDRVISESLPTLPPGKTWRVCVDVSSMGKELLAHVVRSCLGKMREKVAELQFLYAPAKFTLPPSVSSKATAFHLLEGFEGWTQFPEKPLTAILGLGYEQDQALGALEYLDPNTAWSFLPVGRDAKFERAVLRSNSVLIDYLHPHRTIRYLVDNPIGTFADLRAIVESILPSSRVDLIPGGPKLFTLLCLLLRAKYGEEVSVWRISAHGKHPIVDKVADGTVVGFSLTSIIQDQ